MIKIRHVLGVAIFFFIIFNCSAPETTGKVVYVTDGDTFHMLIKSKKVKVRLADIDAPEISQPFGLEAKEALMRHIKDKEVRVHIRDTDRYGRKVAYVYLDGDDINLQMIRDGYAWWYRKYAPENDGYKAAEDEARTSRQGLWSAQNPLAPWDWRRNR